ncbi:MAG: PilN domain-containing protein [Syntrophaceae bacterium]
MTIAGAINKTKFLVTEGAAKISWWWPTLLKILSFSIADEHIAPKQCLSVELTMGRVSVTHASRFLSRIKIHGLRRYQYEAGKYPTPENLTSAVTLAVRDLRAQKTHVVLVIPKAWAIVRTADFPVTVRDNISNVVAFELDRLTPLLSERAYYDFRIIKQEETSIQVMLAAVNADKLQPYVDALKEAGINTRQVIVSLSAVGTLCHYIHGKGRAVFVEISDRRYEGGFISDGEWKESFTGNFSGGDEEAKIKNLASEISALADTIKEESNAAPEVFVNCPPTGKWRSMLPNIINAPVRFFGEINTNLRFLKMEDAHEIPPAALGGILESLWPRASVMNLLDKGIHNPSKMPLAATVILLLVIAGLIMFWLVSPVQIGEKRIAAIDGEINARKEDVKKIEAIQKDMEGMQKELSTIRDFKTSRPVVLNLLKEMTKSLPKNTWLSRIRITETAIDIEGYAASATDIVPKLEASPYFKKVEFASPTFRDTRMSADRFVIKMELDSLQEGKSSNEKKQ